MGARTGMSLYVFAEIKLICIFTYYNSARRIVDKEKCHFHSDVVYTCFHKVVIVIMCITA
jgi:hypothetical protein